MEFKIKHSISAKESLVHTNTTDGQLVLPQNISTLFYDVLFVSDIIQTC